MQKNVKIPPRPTSPIHQGGAPLSRVTTGDRDPDLESAANYSKICGPFGLFYRALEIINLRPSRVRGDERLCYLLFLLTSLSPFIQVAILYGT